MSVACDKVHPDESPRAITTFRRKLGRAGKAPLSSELRRRAISIASQQDTNNGAGGKCDQPKDKQPDDGRRNRPLSLSKKFQTLDLGEVELNISDFDSDSSDLSGDTPKSPQMEQLCVTPSSPNERRKSTESTPRRERRQREMKRKWASVDRPDPDELVRRANDNTSDDGENVAASTRSSSSTPVSDTEEPSQTEFDSIIVGQNN